MVFLGGWGVAELCSVVRDSLLVTYLHTYWLYQALEAAVEKMSGGFDSGFAQGFAQGFAAGREA